MRRTQLTARRAEIGPWIAFALAGAWVALVAFEPAPLLPLADAYRGFCEEHPVLARITNHAPPVVVTLLVSIAAIAALNGGRAAFATLFSTLRFQHALRRAGCTPPAHLTHLARTLDLNGRLVYLPRPELAAFCYGFLRPRVAVSAGLFASLDDEQLLAVLLHEREHLRRRDPARYLALHTVGAVAFMLPLAAPLRRRLEARIELNADRAAIAAVGREALASALLATLVAPRPALVGAVGLSATEARIAHLSGAPALPSVPAATIAASASLAALIALAAAHLAATADAMRLVCEFCADLT